MEVQLNCNADIMDVDNIIISEGIHRDVFWLHGKCVKDL